jgi:hypothetical protein
MGSGRQRPRDGGAACGPDSEIEGFPAMFCWTRPFAAFERYLPAGLALL